MKRVLVSASILAAFLTAAAGPATADAQPPRARVNARTAASLSLGGGDKVRVSQGNGSALLDLQIDDRLADGVVRVAAAHPSTAALGPMFGPVRLERA